MSLSLPIFFLFTLRRKQQLLMLLTALGHQRQSKLYAFGSFFSLHFSISIDSFCMSQLFAHKLTLSTYFFFSRVFMILTPILPRVELGSLYCEARCWMISVCIPCVSWSRHAFLELEKKNESKLNIGWHIDHKR